SVCVCVLVYSCVVECVSALFVCAVLCICLFVLCCVFVCLCCVVYLFVCAVLCICLFVLCCVFVFMFLLSLSLLCLEKHKDFCPIAGNEQNRDVQGSLICVSDAIKTKGGG